MVTAFTPTARQDGSSGLGSHADAEPVRLFAPAPIRLKRSFHCFDSKSLNFWICLTCTTAFACARNPISSAPERNFTSYSAAKALSMSASVKKFHHVKVFSCSSIRAYASVCPSSGSHRREHFSNGDGVPRMAFFLHLLKKLWVTPGCRSIALVPPTPYFVCITLLFSSI